MKVAILTDTHANLPALHVALDAITKEGCDVIYHTGDAIGIGPYPAECLDLLLNTPNIKLIMGNHDAWFAYGLPQPRPVWMSAGEVLHHRWVHSCLNPALRSVVGQWPYVIEEKFEKVHITFLHYGLDASQKNFLSIVRDPRPGDLDNMFRANRSDVVFYGHHHPASDIRGQARYVNPGSLGCFQEPLARFIILECSKSDYQLDKRAISYTDKDLFREFERRNVPEREFIYQVFFGRKP